MKKLLLCLVALCCSAVMWADMWDDEARTDVKVDSATGLSYYLDEEENAIITYQNADEENNYADWTTVTIPETIDGYTVTTIGPWAFCYAGLEGKLTIPGYILYEANGCFSNCTGLETVEYEYNEIAMTDLVDTAWFNAFAYCSNINTVVCDRDIVVTYSTRIVAPFAYLGGIETVYIGEHVTTIPNYAFRSNYAAMLKYVISDAPTPPALGTSVFDNANSALTFYTQADYLFGYWDDSDWVNNFGKDNMHAYDGDDPEIPIDENAFEVDGLWFTPNFDAAEEEDGTCSVTSPQDGTIYEGAMPTIPATITNPDTGATYEVTRIGEKAFAESNIEGSVLIPATIYYLAQDCFASCTGITEVTIEYCYTPLFEENTHNMTDQSFGGCSGLTTVYLNRDVTNDCSSSTQCTAFNNTTSIQHVFIGNQVTYIPQYMFRNTQTVPSLVDCVCYAAEPPAISAGPFNAKNPANYDPDPVLYVWDEYYEIYEESDLYLTGGDWDYLESIEWSPYADMDYPFDDYPEGWEGKGDVEESEESEEDGITSIEIDASAKTKGIYNLAGQRVSASTKGLLIVDGKKVIVK